MRAAWGAYRFTNPSRVANSPLVSWDLMGSQHFAFESGAVIVVTFCLKSEGTPCQRSNGGRPGGTLTPAGTPPPSGAWRSSLGRQTFSIEFSLPLKVRHLQPQPRLRSCLEVSRRSNRPAHVQSPHILRPHSPGALAFLPCGPGTAVHPGLPGHRAHGSVVSPF